MNEARFEYHLPANYSQFIATYFNWNILCALDWIDGNAPTMPNHAGIFVLKKK